ncbi:MAG TPA: error-prone DNA polymerase, partial [Chromatiales bacterium]|nr:error-prone DNA polymerase [Chromatiales bacterium]
LRRPAEAEEIVADYRYLGLSLRRHPLALLRDGLRRAGIVSVRQAGRCSNGMRLRTAGLVVARQRPGSAGGVVFVTLEDETGSLNVIVRDQLVRRQRRELLGARLLAVSGKVQRQGEVLHLLAHRIGDLSHLLGKLQVASRDFH